MAERFVPSRGAGRDLVEIARVNDLNNPQSEFAPAKTGQLLSPGQTVRVTRPIETLRLPSPVGLLGRENSVTILVTVDQPLLRILCVDGTVVGSTIQSQGEFRFTPDGDSMWLGVFITGNQIDANSIGLSRLQQIAPGRLLGTRIDDPNPSNVDDLVGTEVGELIRFGTSQTITDATGTITLNDNTTTITYSGTNDLQGIAGGSEGRRLVFRPSSGSSQLSLRYLNAGAAGTDQIVPPNDQDLYPRSRAYRNHVTLQYISGTWRVLGQSLDSGYSVQRRLPWWFDDFEIAATPPTTTGILTTGARNWRFVVNAGTWAITQPAFAGANGVVRFDPDNVNPRSMELYSSISGGAPFRFECFSSVIWAVRLRTAITGVTLNCGVRTPGAAGATFFYNQASSTALRAATTEASAGSTTYDTTTGVTWLAGEMHVLRIDRVVNDLWFYVDDVLTNMVPSATHGIGGGDSLNVYLTWTVTSTNAEIEIDFAGFNGVRTY